ncbi:trichohyalin-like isoform X2 [Polypterus senegalus]|uniref:trichohyalin-like isoform X2 n=1 Tax=Polypterus senegalus TaxID=55291 RepID=UPI0019633AC4|nr:trichohyalin-like isoform X2 [Polypterus senegalus]
MNSLSLLSRGSGHIVNSGQKKLGVFLDSEDYMNLDRRLQDSRKLVLPPLCHQDAIPKTMSQTFPVSKTYTTKKGALVLYSEELPLTVKKRKQFKTSSSSLKLINQQQTLNNLTRAILIYTSHQRSQLLTVKSRSKGYTFQSSYSGKPYLSSWSVNWDTDSSKKVEDAGSFKTIQFQPESGEKTYGNEDKGLLHINRARKLAPPALAIAASPLDLLDEEPAPARHNSLAQTPRAADFAVVGPPEGIPNRRRHCGNSGAGTKRRCFRCGQTGHLASKCHFSPAQSMEVDLSQNAGVESRSVRRAAVKRSMNRHIPQEAGIYAQLVNTDDNKSFASFYGGSFQGNRKADSLRLPPLKTCQEPLSNSPTTAPVNKDTCYKDDKKKPDDGQIKNKSEGEQRHKKGNCQSELMPELKIESCFSKGDGLHVPEQMFVSLHRNKHWNRGVFRQTMDIKRNSSFKELSSSQSLELQEQWSALRELILHHQGSASLSEEKRQQAIKHLTKTNMSLETLVSLIQAGDLAAGSNQKSVASYAPQKEKWISPGAKLTQEVQKTGDETEISERKVDVITLSQLTDKLLTESSENKGEISTQSMELLSFKDKDNESSTCHHHLKIDLNILTQLLAETQLQDKEEVTDLATNIEKEGNSSEYQGIEKSEDFRFTAPSKNVGSKAAHSKSDQKSQSNQWLQDAASQMVFADKEQSFGRGIGRPSDLLQNDQNLFQAFSSVTGGQVNPLQQVPVEELNEEAFLQQLIQSINNKEKKDNQKKLNKSSTAAITGMNSKTKKKAFVVGKPRAKKPNIPFQKALEDVLPADVETDKQEKTVNLPEFPAEPLQEQKKLNSSQSSLSAEDSQKHLREDDNTENSEENQKQAIENRDLKRVQQAEWRRLEVERKRKEKEQQRRREQEEKEQEARMVQELNEQVAKRLAELREKKQKEEEERLQKEKELEALHQEEKRQREREKQIMEEQNRKLQEIQRKIWEANQLREAEAARKRMEEEKKFLEEQAYLAAMAEQERDQYLRKKREEDERRRKEQEEKQRQEQEAAKIRMEAARKEAERIIREQWETERRLHFHNDLLCEATGLEQSQEVNRPWICAYYDAVKTSELSNY